MLEILVEADGPASAKELTEVSGFHLNVTYRLISALEDAGFAIRDERSREYAIGPKLIALAAKVTKGLSVREAALPIMRMLVDETSETVTLHARSGGDRVCVAIVEGTHDVRRVIPEGQLLPLHVGPSGKAILAFLDPADQAEVLERAVQAGESATRIRRQLDEVRRQGSLATVSDRLPGVSGLSAPIFDSTGVVASLTVSGPADRWTQSAMGAAAPRVRERARELSQSLGARPQSPSELAGIGIP